MPNPPPFLLSQGMCLASGNLLVARPSWPWLHGLEARATLENYLASYMAKHILRRKHERRLVNALHSSYYGSIKSKGV
jgi:hypothetical protein